MTIELTPGKPVKWLEGDAWHTGRVLEAEAFEAFHGIQPITLVKDSNTSKVLAVASSQLQNNTCREDERKAEAQEKTEIDEVLEAAWDWFIGQTEIRLGKDGDYHTLVDENGEILCAGSSQDWAVLGFYKAILEAQVRAESEPTQ